ncbi:helix-turn-helix domain-containing protein [Catenulispora subtropica]|uniref:HTH araC/xylS-type domain-containing protein n=1 Tax=Catenulispora subtropica TaxID=450798 RepID=A0ABN2SV05_9ACTN
MRTLYSSSGPGIRRPAPVAGPASVAGTVAAPLVRPLLAAVSPIGGERTRLGRLPGLNPSALADDLTRIPSVSVVPVWEALTSVEDGRAITAAVLDGLPMGALGVWDQLFAAGRTLLDGLRDALDLWCVVGDPAVTSFEVVADGALVTVRHLASAADPGVAALRTRCTLGLLGRRLAAAGRTAVTPVRAAFVQPAPRRHRGPEGPTGSAALAELFGTANLDFGAGADTVTFLAADLTRPLPDHRPGLSEMLREYATMRLQASRPVASWLDLFRAHLEAGVNQGAPSLAALARAMASSPRTVQRRLGEHGTTWRAEVDLARAAHAAQLRESDLTMRSMAARMGYSDGRALRRAMRRWHEAPQRGA